MTRYALLLLAGAAALGAQAAPQKKPAPQTDPATCFACHDQIEKLKTTGKHRALRCETCHEGLAQHVEDSDKKPVTLTALEVCGGCHKDQYGSFVDVNLASKARVEKATFKSRSPLFDKLMMPHGFTKEHAEPRSHVFMLADHLIVDRAYGGRFQLKDWSKIAASHDVAHDVWSVLTDADPGSSEQKPFLTQVAVAANPVCLSCKTQDNVLQWKYMGDKDPRARWDRTSSVVEVARSVKHPINCFACHDPHSGGPRVIRDALIEAVVDRGLGTYPYDPEKSAKTKIEKVMFRDDFRAVGYLSRPDSNLMCAQCHVEYACNPGTDPKTGAKIGMSDRRTNYFPWSNVFDLWERYEKQGFKDFQHAGTGAYLTKLQHPETETFWGSKHERAGVECKDCHMPKAKNKAGKTYTFHGQRSARYMKKDTCVRCHKDWSEAEAEYQIDAIQNYIRGKMTKAEFWLGELIDAFAAAKAAGVSDADLAKARAAHDKAHILWEWWTAENSDGFHNPDAARKSLTQSIDLTQSAIKELQKATTAVPKPVAAHAPAPAPAASAAPAAPAAKGS